MIEELENYRRLVERVDELCRQIEERYRPVLACRRGCDACCRHLSLFWVEGLALARTAETLPAAEAARLRERARQSGPDDPCPLLENGACLLYPARPLICRTHGLPLLTAGEGERRIDFCPENFRGIANLPAAAVIDLDRLNLALAGINALFMARRFGGNRSAGERLTIAEFLLLDLR
jgi:Fe-S-cluster containining protein